MARTGQVNSRPLHAGPASPRCSPGRRWQPPAPWSLGADARRAQLLIGEALDWLPAHETALRVRLVEGYLRAGIAGDATMLAGLGEVEPEMLERAGHERMLSDAVPAMTVSRISRRRWTAWTTTCPASDPLYRVAGATIAAAVGRPVTVDYLEHSGTASAVPSPRRRGGGTDRARAWGV